MYNVYMDINKLENSSQFVVIESQAVVLSMKYK